MSGTEDRPVRAEIHGGQGSQVGDGNVQYNLWVTGATVPGAMAGLASAQGPAGRNRQSAQERAYKRFIGAVPHASFKRAEWRPQRPGKVHKFLKAASSGTFVMYVPEVPSYLVTSVSGALSDVQAFVSDPLKLGDLAAYLGTLSFREIHEASGYQIDTYSPSFDIYPAGPVDGYFESMRERLRMYFEECSGE